ncbi:MAG: hypothetical protein ACYS80_06720, partial [Planctomycetota bacterium]
PMEHDNESFSASLSSVFSSHRQRGHFSITTKHTTWDDYWMVGLRVCSGLPDVATPESQTTRKERDYSQPERVEQELRDQLERDRHPPCPASTSANIQWSASLIPSFPALPADWPSGRPDCLSDSPTDKS